jgi:preprotein translocase subunit SecB
MNCLLKAIRTNEMSIKMNNIKLEPNTKFDLKPTFSRQIRKMTENDKVTFVSLEVKIESTAENPKPFNLLIRITGIFEVNLDGIEDKNNFTVESTQILYPYLRSSVSALTAASFTMPIILPVMKSNILFPEDAGILNNEGGLGKNVPDDGYLS